MAEKHDHHIFLIIILTVAVLVLIAIAGFFGYELFYGDTVRTVKRVEFDGSALDEGLQAQQDILEESLEEEEDTVPEPTSNLIRFNGTAIAPGFSYPNDWHVFSSTSLSQQPGVVNTGFLNPEPIQILEGTDATPGVIIMNVFDLSTFNLQGHATYREYLEDTLTNEFILSLDSSSEAHLGGTLTSFTGRQESGLGPDHDFEFIVFETATTAVSIHFKDTILGSEDNQVWDIVKNSLDFSSIQ